MVFLFCLEAAGGLFAIGLVLIMLYIALKIAHYALIGALSEGDKQ